MGSVSVKYKAKLLGGLKRLGWLHGLLLSILTTVGGTSIASLLIGLPPPVLLDDFVVLGALLAWILVNLFESVSKTMAWPLIHHSMVILAEVLRANTLCTYVHISMYRSHGALLTVAAGTIAASGGAIIVPFGRIFKGVTSCWVPWPLQSAVMGAIVYRSAVGSLCILPAIVRITISTTFVSVALLQTYYGPTLNPASLLSLFIHRLLATTLPRRIVPSSFHGSPVSNHCIRDTLNQKSSTTTTHHIPAVEHMMLFFFTIVIGLVLRQPVQQPLASLSLDPSELLVRRSSLAAAASAAAADYQRWLSGGRFIELSSSNDHLINMEEKEIERGNNFMAVTSNEGVEGLPARLMALEMRLEEIEIKSRYLHGEVLPLSVDIAYEILLPARKAVLNLNDDGIESEGNNHRKAVLIAAEQLSFAESAINAASEVVDTALQRYQQHNDPTSCQLGHLATRQQLDLPFDDAAVAAQSSAVGIGDGSCTIVRQVNDWRDALSQSTLHLTAELDNALAMAKVAGVIVATEDGRDMISGDGEEEMTKATDEAFEILKDITRYALDGNGSCSFPNASEQTEATAADMVELELIDYKLEQARNSIRKAIAEVDRSIYSEAERSFAADTLQLLIHDLEATLTSSIDLNLSSVFVQGVREVRSEAALIEHVKQSLLDKESWARGRLSALDYFHRGKIVLDTTQNVFHRILDAFQVMEHLEEQSDLIGKQPEDLKVEVLQIAAQELRHTTKSKLARIREAMSKTETQEAFWLLFNASVSDIVTTIEDFQTLRRSSSTIVEMEDKNAQHMSALRAVEELKAELDHVECMVGYSGMMVRCAQRKIESITTILSSECWEYGCKEEWSNGDSQNRCPCNSMANTTMNVLVMSARDAVTRAVIASKGATVKSERVGGGTSLDGKTLIFKTDYGGWWHSNNVMEQQQLPTVVVTSTSPPASATIVEGGSTTSLPSAKEDATAPFLAAEIVPPPSGQEKRTARRLQRAVDELNKCCSAMGNENAPPLTSCFNDGEGLALKKSDHRYWVNKAMFEAQEAVKVATKLWDDRRALDDECNSSSNYVEFEMVVNQAVVRTAAACSAVRNMSERMMEARTRQKRGISLVSAMEVEVGKLMKISNGLCGILPEVFEAEASLAVCKGLVYGPLEHWITPSSLTAAVSGGSDSETSDSYVHSSRMMMNCKAAIVVAKEACLKAEKTRAAANRALEKDETASLDGDSLGNLNGIVEKIPVDKKEAGADSILELCRTEVATSWFSAEKIDDGGAAAWFSLKEVLPECRSLVTVMRKEEKRLATAEERLRLVEADVDEMDGAHVATRMDKRIVAARAAIDSARGSLTSYKTIQDTVSAVQEAVDSVNDARIQFKSVASALSAANKRKRKVEMRAMELQKALDHAESMFVKEKRGKSSHMYASNTIHDASAELEVLFLQLSSTNGTNTLVGDILGDEQGDYEWTLQHVEKCVKEAKRASSIALQDIRRVNALENELNSVYHEAHRLWPSGLLPREIEGMFISAWNNIANYTGGELIEVRIAVEAIRITVDKEKSANNLRQRALGQLAKVEASLAASVATLRASGISMTTTKGGEVEICCSNCTVVLPLSAIRSICTAQKASHLTMNLINSSINAITGNISEVEGAIDRALKAASMAKREASSASAAAKRVEKDRRALILRVKLLEHDAHAGGIGHRVVELMPALKEYLARPVGEFLMNPPPMQVKDMTAFTKEVALLEIHIRTAIIDVPWLKKLVKRQQMAISRVKALDSSPFAHLLNCSSSMETVREKMDFCSTVAKRLQLEPISHGRNGTKAFERAVNEFVHAVDSVEADLDSSMHLVHVVEYEESKTSLELQRLALILDETKQYNASIWETLEEQPETKRWGVSFFVGNEEGHQQCALPGIWDSFHENQHATTLSRKTCNAYEAVGAELPPSTMTGCSNLYQQCLRDRLFEAVKIRKESNKGRRRVSRCLNKAKRLFQEREVGHTTRRAVAVASLHKFILASLGVGTYYAAWIVFTIVLG